jgi:hypothetical protein
MDQILMLTTIIVALITAVLGPIAVAWAKNKFTPKKKSSMIVDSIQASNLVDNQLDTIMKEINADRVFVLQFHNGGHFYPTNKSIAKFSIFYEHLTPGTIPSQQTFQNIPCSLFTKSISELYENGEISCPTLEYETFGLLPVCEQHGSSSFYMIALEDLKGNFIGVVSISFKKHHKLSKDEWIFLRQKAGVIGTLLGGYLDSQK